MVLTGFLIIVANVVNRNEDLKKTLKISHILLVIFMVFTFFLLLKDEAPVRNDYSFRDITYEDSNSLKAYSSIKKILSSFDAGAVEPDTEAIKDLDNYLKNADIIRKLWHQIEPYRSIVEELDTYNEFGSIYKEEQLNFKTSGLNFSLLRAISEIYQAYSILKIDQGYTEEGLKQLCRLHSVARKGFAGSGTLIDKKIWLYVIKKNIDTAYKIITTRKCSTFTYRFLQKNFRPLIREEISFETVFIAEYLMTKRYINNTVTAASFFDSFNMVSDEKKNAGFFKSLLSSIVYYLSFKKNSTINDYRTFITYYIEGGNYNPPDFSTAKDYLEVYLHSPQLLNMAGWIFINVSYPDYDKLCSSISDTKVKSDMLAISIAELLNETIDINDYYTGTPYNLQKTGFELLTPGRDGVTGTDDDIILGGNK